MKSSLLLALQGSWLSCRDGVWAETTEFPRLPANTNILCDFDSAPFGVMPVDTRPDFAAAVIEKTLRSEGLVDGEVHMLPHRIFAVGGGSKVLYTAVPLTFWQSVFAWLGTQTDIHLLFSVETAMLALSQKHDAVLCRVGRQFRLLVSNPTTLVSISVNAYSDDIDDIETALNNLCDQARPQWSPRNEKMNILWVDLLAPGKNVEAAHTAHVAKRLGVQVVVAPTVAFGNAEKTLHSAADTFMDVLSWRNALNPTLDRVASASDRFGLPIAALTAACGAGLLAVSAFWGIQTAQMKSREQDITQEIAKIDAQNGQYAVSPNTLLEPFKPTTQFLGKLQEAVNSPDPLDFLAHLRKASEQRVRVMRVRLNPLDGSFRVDGVPYTDVASANSLSGFIAEMQVLGYELKSEDPGSQGQQTGYFSYSVTKSKNSAGGKL
ncbi:hypothetical protein [Undibacterium fentianense]|uniref:Uncharacterized protein n=1 Tax=Undibacterium fentianense TaxID=2828728 RepID=A0A941IHC9_9BURK|nr:hypothetical protein [Undibacterium fentianense]MBR7800850.1 hypothetical protein [Undibacterium fentianense]